MPSSDLDDLSRDELIARIEALEARLAEQGAGAQRGAAARAWAARLMMGGNLYRATQQGWNAWERWIQSAERTLWPRHETRDFMAALVTRLTRVHTLSLLVALLPTLLILIQVWILVQQNTILERQNGLFAFEQVDNFKERFAQERSNGYWRVSYSTVAAIVDFAEEQPRVVSSALQPLLLDANGSVAAGALLAFYAMDPDRDLRGVRAQYVDFEDVTLEGARLSGADFSHARFFGVTLAQAELRGANLNDTDLGGSAFVEADLQEATLLNAVFDGADFTGATLRDADLRAADVDRANFTDADLRGANLLGLRNWQRIGSIDGARIDGVRGAPEGFTAWALSNGAVE